MTKKRIVTILAALLALALLASVLFIALEAHHDCHGEDCVICAQLVVCGELLQQLALLTVFVLAASALRSGVAALRDARYRVCGRFSLVRLKVKLSD